MLYFDSEGNCFLEISLQSDPTVLKRPLSVQTKVLEITFRFRMVVKIFPTTYF